MLWVLVIAFINGTFAMADMPSEEFCVAVSRRAERLAEAQDAAQEAMLPLLLAHEKLTLLP